MLSNIICSLNLLKIELCLYSSKACLINPIESLLSCMFFAAYNISKAEANSAAANSFKTKLHLSGLNFLKFFFGIKNIITILVYLLFLLISNAKSKDCLPFIPYGWNDFYVHLPQNITFCVDVGKTSYNYKTDIYGGRIISNDRFEKWLQVFGDSQVVGLNLDKIDKHYLSKINGNSNFIIYAAPNNGPYEVINFLTKNEKILKKRIIITFNFAVDIYRINSTWQPTNYVALRDYQLDEIIENPLKYKFIIFKNLLFNKNFTTRRFNNQRMQKLFLNSNNDDIYKNLIKYFDELNQLAIDNNLNITFVVTHPYWLYSKFGNNLTLDRNLSNKVYKLICKSFKKTNNIDNILVSRASNNFSFDDLTSDKRHIKSKKINLEDIETLCKDYF